MRVIGTDLVNPDFVMMARGMGANAELVTRTEEFAPAFARARQSRRPSLIALQTDPELITTTTTISAIRQAAKPS
jgi:acetolactate synthase-1/2/3 large subunit